MADAHELIAEMRVSLAIGQRVRHTDFRRKRVTGVVHGMSIEAERGLMVTVLLDEPIVIPPIAGIDGDRETLIHWQTAQAHEFAPFDERDELIAELINALRDLEGIAGCLEATCEGDKGTRDNAIDAARIALAKATGSAS